MNDRSSVTRSTVSGREDRVRRLVRSMTTTRSSSASRGSSWPCPTSSAYSRRAPRRSRTSLKPPVDAPASRHGHAVDHHAEGIEGSHQLVRAARGPRRPGIAHEASGRGPPAGRRSGDGRWRRPGGSCRQDRAPGPRPGNGRDRDRRRAGRRGPVPPAASRASVRRRSRSGPRRVSAGTSIPSASPMRLTMPGTSIRCCQRRSSTEPWSTKPSASAIFRSGARTPAWLRTSSTPSPNPPMAALSSAVTTSRLPAAWLARRAASSGFAHRALITVAVRPAAPSSRAASRSRWTIGPNPTSSRSDPFLEDLGHADLERLALPVGQVLAGIARIVQGDGSVMGQRGDHEVPELLLVLGRADDQVRQRPLGRQGEHPLVARAVLADEPRAIDGQDDRRIVLADVVHELVEGPLAEGRVDRDHRSHPGQRETGGHRHGMLLGDADIEESRREAVLERGQAGSGRHPGGDGADPRIGLRRGGSAPRRRRGCRSSASAAGRRAPAAALRWDRSVPGRSAAGSRRGTPGCPARPARSHGP